MKPLEPACCRFRVTPRLKCPPQGPCPKTPSEKYLHKSFWASEGCPARGQGLGSLTGREPGGIRPVARQGPGLIQSSGGLGWATWGVGLKCNVQQKKRRLEEENRPEQLSPALGVPGHFPHAADMPGTAAHRGRRSTRANRDEPAVEHRALFPSHLPLGSTRA